MSQQKPNECNESISSDEIISEAKRIITEANKRQIVLRSLGGVAIRVRCKSSLDKSLRRRIADIDLAGLSRQRSGIERLFRDLGYSPGFNAIRFERLIFFDSQKRKVDLFLDTFEMCHKLHLKYRLELDDATLTLADLLMTKLQVFEFTEREYKDVTALFIDFDVSAQDSGNTINGKYVAEVCAADWGLWRTLTLNLDRLESHLSNYLQDPQRQAIVRERIEHLRDFVNGEPKTFRWKRRAIVGEQVKWYNLPEEPMTNTV